MDKYLRSFPTYWLLGCALVFQNPTAYSAPILSGSVTQSGSLYTYSYTLDNTSGPGPIRSIFILINTLGYVPSLLPVSHTEPPNWGFGIAFGGVPGVDAGMTWGWGGDITGLGLPVGQTLSGFSFTTTRAPTTSTANNYNLFCPEFCGPFTDGDVEIGHIVAPADFLVAPPPPPGTPEPSFFWPVLVLGLTVLLLRGRSTVKF